jgi:peptidyl-prolyl cis-trans isomerase D
MFGMVIVTFVVFFGPQTTGWGGGDDAASRADSVVVNGERIPESAFTLMYMSQYRSMQAQNPDFDITKAREMDLRNRVMDNLVEQVLLAQAATSQGMRVTDDELARTISETFQRDGKFDRDLYQRQINYGLQTSLRTYEEMQRRQMLAARLVTAVNDGVQVSDDEVRLEFVNRNDKLELSFVRVDPRHFRDQVTIGDEEVKKYVTDGKADIEKTYEDRKYKYQQPEKRRARHILKRAGKDARGDEADKAREAVAAIAAKIAGGADFAEIARTESEDPGSAVQGGDLGFFPRGQMDKAFEEATWKLSPGQVSEPVRSAFGFHLIKLEETQAASEKSLDDVREEIARDLLHERGAKDKAKAVAEELLAKLKAGTAFEELVPKDPALPKDKKLTDLTPDERKAWDAERKKVNPYELSVEETSEFARSAASYVPRIGVNKELHDAVFSLTTEKPVPERVFDVSDRVYVVRLAGRTPADLGKLADASKNIAEQLRATKAAAAVKDWMERLKDDASVKKNTDLLRYGGQGEEEGEGEGEGEGEKAAEEAESGSGG